MSPIAIDAFAGAGGLSLGLQRAGWDVRLAYDNDPVAVATYELNLESHVLLLDAAKLTPEELLELAELQPGECDLLAGGPPCQGFSIQRHDGAEDPRNLLLARFRDQILGLRPKAFLMENVPALMSRRGRHLVKDLIDATERVGYRCASTTLNAVDYRVPQRRRRAFIVGTAEGVSEFNWPAPARGKQLTVEDVFAGLPSPPADGSPHPEIANHYREARLSELNRERIRHVPPGGGREHLPAHLQLRCHSNGHRHLDTYGRLAWDEPSVTLTARFDSFTRGKFGHPTEDRSITLREGARLQGFPDDYVFAGTRGDGARLIGNAVPPPLATALGRALIRALKQAPLSLAA
jgi:DNA (cytosine-5)-methyltransferase 1